MLFDKLNLLFLATVAASVAYCLAMPGAFFVQVILWATLAATLGAGIRFVMLVGELNIGTSAFYGIGGYTAAYLTTAHGLPFGVALVAAGIAGGLVAAVFGYATMRTSGAYFMLISFAFAEIFRMLVVESDFLGGNNGIIGLFVSVEYEPYFAATVVAILATLISALAVIENSSLGKSFIAIREREEIARSVGINVLAIRVLCLVISSVVIAVAGACSGFITHLVAPDDYTFMIAVFALAYVKLGGEEHPTGPILGAILLTLAAQYLISFGAYQQVFFGTVIAVAMILLPQGITGRLRDLVRLTAKRTARDAR
jgi:branched-chain amino acid transport system permease protein